MRCHYGKNEKKYVDMPGLNICLGIASFISYSSFNVINPFVTTSGLAQIFNG